MKSFQKIPHKERMRHIKYRDEMWNRQEERALKKAIEEIEKMKRELTPPVVERSDKEREELLAVARLQELAERN